MVPQDIYIFELSRLMYMKIQRRQKNRFVVKMVENIMLLIIASYKLSTALTAVPTCWQLWRLLQVVASIEVFTSFCQLWQPLQAVGSFDSFYKLSLALAAVTSCTQLWKLLQAVNICNMLSPALTAVTSCCQLIQAVVSCCQLLQAVFSSYKLQNTLL